MAEPSDDLLMWGHYSRNHEGLVLGFDETHEYFHQRKSAEDDLRHLRKVEYRAQRPNLPASELTATELYLVKGDEWAYECEWRIARPLSDATVVENSEKGLLHLFDFPPSCLRSVILGFRMSEAHRYSIRQILGAAGHYSHVEIYKARRHESEYRLEILRDQPSTIQPPG